MKCQDKHRSVCRILKGGVNFGIPHGDYLFVIKDTVVQIAKIDNHEMPGENAKFCNCNSKP